LFAHRSQAFHWLSFATYTVAHFAQSFNSLVVMSILFYPTHPNFNGETAQAFLAMVMDPSYKKKSRPTQEIRNRMLEFSMHFCLPYLPHEKQLAH
jgi:hypothetical protein